MNSKLTAVAICTAVTVIGSGGYAVAATSITGKTIKNGTVTTKDIKKGTIKLDRLSKGTQALIRKAGTPGRNGANGANGAPGAPGAGGAVGGAGVAGANGFFPVTAAGNGFSASNSSVKFTNDGVTFGPFGGQNQPTGGTANLAGAVPAGATLADIAELEYTASYDHTGNTPDNGDAPYLRVFIDNDGDGFDFATAGDPGSDDHDVIFSPSTQLASSENLQGCATGAAGAAQCATSGRTIEYKVSEGSVRYDDDAGNNADTTWDAVVNAHKTDKVESIRVSLGNSLQGTETGTLNSLKTEFDGSAPTTYSFSR